MQRVLIIGPDFFGYNESIASAFQQNGFEAKVISSPMHSPTGIINRILIDGMRHFGINFFAKKWRINFNKKISRLASEYQPDIVLLIKGDWVDPEVFAQISAQKRAVWFQDVAIRCGMNHLDHAKIADAAFVFEPGDLEYLS